MRYRCPECGQMVRLRLRDDRFQHHNRSVLELRRWKRVKCPGTGRERLAGSQSTEREIDDEYSY